MGFFSRSVRVIIVLAIAISIAVFLVAIKAKPEKIEREESIPLAEFIVATPSSIIMRVEAFGTVKPRKSAKITAEVPGRIEYINPLFAEGGFLKKGELLLGIDSRSYELNRDASLVNIRQAKADIARLEQEIVNYKTDILLAQRNFKLSSAEFNRMTKLSKVNYATKNQLDSSEMAYLKATMQVQDITNRLALTDSIMDQKKGVLKMARVDLEKANLALEKTKIRADFEGYVMDKFVEEGEYVNTGQALGHIYLKSQLDVDVSIPMEKMKWFEHTMKDGSMPRVDLQIAGPVGDDSLIWHGKVVRVKANIDEKTRTLPMTIEIDNIDNSPESIYKLRPGTFVKCNINGETFENIFVLPRYLINQNTLFIVENGKLQKKEVKVLRKFEEEVYIQSGLKKGDKILSTPIPGAIHGMKVKLKG
ncbi:MAG: efflux RND transporter periplasmic adaptor subunit [Desulfobacterales bacterium]|nr:efflux RND transporter periplasmic adaptor subunit [Desulfobacterales bacterium]